MAQKHRVVIVGGGFGGLYAAQNLKSDNVDVTLIDRRNFHLFQPLLYQVATGGLSPGDIAAPLRAVFREQKNVKVLLGEVVDLDVQAKKVIMTDGECEYDTLVLAPGSQTSYFGNDQWKAFAPGLKSIEEATEIRHRILFAFEEAEKLADVDVAKRRAWLTFVVVGAGPTGVELAGTLGEIAHDTMKDDFRNIRPEDARILLVDGNSRVLTPYPPELSKSAEQQLISLNVRFRANVRVTKVDEDGVTIQGERGEEKIATHTVLWAAGVTANPLGRLVAAKTGAETDKSGRVKVEKDCTVAGHPEIFVIGDLSLFTHQTGKPLPGVAPTAIQMGQFVGKEIRRRLAKEPAREFHYWDKGSLATIGRNHAVAEIGKLKFGGSLAWWMWLLIHLIYLVGFQNRLVVAIQWGMQYITFNRGARLITGASRMIQQKALHESESAKV